MDQATQQNAALVEEMAAAASSLDGQAQDLVQVVSVFKLDANDHGPQLAVGANLARPLGGGMRKMTQARKPVAKAPASKLAPPRIGPKALAKPVSMLASLPSSRDDSLENF